MANRKKIPAKGAKKKIRKVPRSQKAPRKSKKVIPAKGNKSFKKSAAPSRVYFYRIKGKVVTKKAFLENKKKEAQKRKRRKREKIKKEKKNLPQLPKFSEVKKKRKPREFAKTDEGKLKNYAIADVSPTLLRVDTVTEVTSQKERYADIHMQLRLESIKKGRFFVPDEKVKTVDTPFNKGFHQSFQVGQFLTDDTIDGITQQAYKHLLDLERKQSGGKARFYIAFHMTEYGLETYGSDKGSIATKDELSTDTLHWTAWGSAGTYEPEATYRLAEAKLKKFLKKSSRTTIAIESIVVTMIYEGN